MQEVKDYIKKYENLLSFKTSVSYTEAEKRACAFLEVMASITNYKHMFAEEKIKYLSIQTAVYAEQMSKGQAATVTQNKAFAEASGEYTQSREDLERVENDISYLKSYYEIFQNAHVFYRNLAKGDNS